MTCYISSSARSVCRAAAFLALADRSYGWFLTRLADWNAPCTMRWFVSADEEEELDLTELLENGHVAWMDREDALDPGALGRRNREAAAEKQAEASAQQQAAEQQHQQQQQAAMQQQQQQRAMLQQQQQQQHAAAANGGQQSSSAGHGMQHGMQVGSH